MQYFNEKLGRMVSYHDAVRAEQLRRADAAERRAKRAEHSARKAERATLVALGANGPTFRAEHPTLRAALLAAGFKPVGEKRVQAPAGMNRREGKATFNRVFKAHAEKVQVTVPCRHCDCWCREDWWATEGGGSHHTLERKVTTFR